MITPFPPPPTHHLLILRLTCFQSCTHSQMSLTNDPGEGVCLCVWVWVCGVVCVYGHIGKSLKISDEELLSAGWCLCDCPSNLLWRECQNLQLSPFRLSHPSQFPSGLPAPVVTFAFGFEASLKASLWILQGFCCPQFDIQAEPEAQERMTQCFPFPNSLFSVAALVLNWGYRRYSSKCCFIPSASYLYP